MHTSILPPVPWRFSLSHEYPGPPSQLLRRAAWHVPPPGSTQARPAQSKSPRHGALMYAPGGGRSSPHAGTVSSPSVATSSAPCRTTFIARIVRGSVAALKPKKSSYRSTHFYVAFTAPTLNTRARRGQPFHRVARSRRGNLQ